MIVQKVMPLAIFLAALIGASSTSLAQDVLIGPAVRLDGGSCSVGFLDGQGGYSSEYFGDEGWTQFSNSNTGHAMFKCKLYLVAGEPIYYLLDAGSDGYVYRLEIEGEKGMLTYSSWESWYEDD
jgi:hypothetical protein